MPENRILLPFNSLVGGGRLIPYSVHGEGQEGDGSFPEGRTAVSPYKRGTNLLWGISMPPSFLYSLANIFGIFDDPR